MSISATATLFDALTFIVLFIGAIVLFSSRPHLIPPFLAWLAGVGAATAIGTLAIVAVLKSQLGMAVVVTTIGML